MSGMARFLTVTASFIVVGGSLVAAPAQAVDATASERTMGRMGSALVRAEDVPRRLGELRTAGVLSGTGQQEQPDVCPTSRKQELDSAAAWATTYYGTGNQQVGLKSSIWLYNSDSEVRRSPRSALTEAVACKNRSRRIDGRLLTHASDRTSARSAWQTMIIRSKKSKPRRTEIATSWRIQGRYLINVSIERYGRTVKPKTKRADIKTAEQLSAVSSRRLESKQQPPAVEAPVFPEAPTMIPPQPAAAPWVVSLGDSYISGEGGAWSGNVENSLNDARVYRGRQTYFDDPDRKAELIEMCHRSDSAAIHIGVARSLNLACSGATTKSATNVDGYWKPGIDFGSQKDGPGRGQAHMLQEFAADNQVRMVALSIGGNDFEFSDLVASCVKAFLLSPYLWPSYCSEDKAVKGKVSDARVDEMSDRIAGAIGNVQTAMRNAGYQPDEWQLVVHNYPSPLPKGNKIRYWQTLLRQSDGGCGFWNRDADWANDTVLPRVNRAVQQAITRSGATNVSALDLSKALNDNRLCEEGTVSVDTSAANKYKPWTLENEYAAREWVMQIRSVSSNYSAATISESFHPNYYGQLAIRNCLRQAYEQQRGGQCVREDRTVTDRGEPNMALR